MNFMSRIINVRSIGGSALRDWPACIRIKGWRKTILQDSWSSNSWMVNLHSQRETLDPHRAEKLKKNPTVSITLSLCKHFDTSVKWNKWVTTHLERFSLQSLSKTMRHASSLPLSLPDWCCGRSSVPRTWWVVILLGWWRLGWGWESVSPS